MAQITLNSSGVASNGTLALQSNGTTTAVTIDTSQNVGIGTSSPTVGLQVDTGSDSRIRLSNSNTVVGQLQATSSAFSVAAVGGSVPLTFYTNGSERMRIDSSGNLLVGKTTSDSAVTSGLELSPFGTIYAARNGALLVANRLTTDGTLITFQQAGTTEGTISVSGTTVSYTGGHLSRWAQTTTAKNESLVKGTVLSNLDEMNVYTDAEGNTVQNEQLNKVKVSDVEGDANVAGVFVNWEHDEAHNVDEINMAMTGDMIIRIAQGVTVQRGDLLMSAGDGTAKPQGDDIVRSKTVAKVTSTHVTCTYADGSFCVPCVLMAC